MVTKSSRTVASRPVSRSKRSNRKEKSGKPTKSTASRFIIIHKKTVVFESEGLADCMAKHCRLPGSVIYGRMGKVSGEEEPVTKRLPSNPIARIIEEISFACELDIVKAVESTIGPQCNLEDSGGDRGLFYPPSKPRPSQPRRATNVQSAKWNAVLTINAAFDLRRELPEQVATWLEELSRRLAAASVRVTAIEDVCKRAVIRRLVCDTKFLETLAAKGLKLGSDGSFISVDAEQSDATEGGAV